jgi:hypothetical protein
VIYYLKPEILINFLKEMNRIKPKRSEIIPNRFKHALKKLNNIDDIDNSEIGFKQKCLIDLLIYIRSYNQFLTLKIMNNLNLKILKIKLI